MFAVGRCCRQRVQGVQTLGASLLAPSSPLGLDSGQQCLPEGLWGGRHSLPSGKVIAKQLPLPGVRGLWRAFRPGPGTPRPGEKAWPSLPTLALLTSVCAPASSQAKLRSRNRSADEGEPSEGKAGQKESMQRSKSCKVPGLGKPHALPPKPDKSSG